MRRKVPCPFIDQRFLDTLDFRRRVGIFHRLCKWLIQIPRLKRHFLRCGLNIEAWAMLDIRVAQGCLWSVRPIRFCGCAGPCLGWSSDDVQVRSYGLRCWLPELATPDRVLNAGKHVFKSVVGVTWLSARRLDASTSRLSERFTCWVWSLIKAAVRALVDIPTHFCDWLCSRLLLLSIHWLSGHVFEHINLRFFIVVGVQDCCSAALAPRVLLRRELDRCACDKLLVIVLLGTQWFLRVDIQSDQVRAAVHQATGWVMHLVLVIAHFLLF